MKRLIYAAALLLIATTGGNAFAATHPPTSATKAAELRAGLNALFREHIFLAAATTGAALDGQFPAKFAK